MPKDNTVLTTIPCTRCKAPVELKRRGRRPKYCAECAHKVKLEQTAESDRRLETDRALVREIANNLRPYVTDDMWLRVEDYIEQLGIDPDKGEGIVPDRMPDGTASHAGPDEGTSTGWADLAAELEEQRMRVIMHDWFTDNPRWFEDA